MVLFKLGSIRQLFKYNRGTGRILKMKKNILQLLSFVFLMSLFIVFITVSCKKVTIETKETESITSETNSAETSGSTSTVTTTSDTTSTETTTSTTSTSQDTNLTQEEAVNIAMTVANGTVDRIETEIEDGKLVWKIRIISDGVRTDVRIDDATGKIIRVETK